jgi:hypothetical protein
MQASDQIEQLLRDSFPFAQHWFFRCTEGHVYYLMNDEDSIALQHHQPPESWGARLDSGGWILAADEGPTPVEAVSNLQTAISQIASIHATVNALAGTTEDAMTDASQALAAAREFQASREFWIKPIEDPQP